MWQRLIKKIDSLNELSRLQKILLIIALLGFIFSLFYNIYYLPKKEKIQNLQKEIEQLDQEIVRYEAIARKEKDLERILIQRRIFLQKVQEMLPTEKEIPVLLNHISKLGRSQGLKIIKFVPTAEIEKNYYHEIPIQVEMITTFPKVFLFFNDLLNLPRIVDLSNAEFIPQEKNKILVKCNLKTFKYTGIELKSSKR